MLYGCTHMATVGVRGLNATVLHTGCRLLNAGLNCGQHIGRPSCLFTAV